MVATKRTATTESAAPGVIAVSFVTKDEVHSLADWSDVGEALKQRPGFKRSVLLVTKGDAPFFFLSLGLWDSEAHIKATLEAIGIGERLKNGATTAWYRAEEGLGDMQASIQGSNLVVIPLNVVAAQVQSLRTRVAQHASFFSKMPGFEAYALLKRVGGGGEYSHVLIARWASQDDLEVAVKGRGASSLVPELPPGSNFPGVYVQASQ